MKTKLFICLALLLALGSCKAPHYVPPTEYVGIERYGSQIIIIPVVGEKIKGEFIAIDDDMFIILNDGTGKITHIPQSDIKRFKIRYAQPKQYGWTIPVSVASTVVHGWFLVFTAPLNAVVSTGATVSGASDFTYKDSAMSYDEIQMFARFPQGIPEGVELGEIDGRSSQE